MTAPNAEAGPQVTVLLPVRNGARTLAGAAESILQQVFRNFELLLIDDGSTDGTPAVIAALAAQDERVRVIKQKPLGLIAALNRGLADARGELIARMDADDIAVPERLALQVAALEAAPGVAFVGSGWRVVNADGAVRRVVTPPATDAALRTAMESANAIAHPTVTMRRDAVLRAGGYRPAFVLAEDYDLWLRLLDRHMGACVPDVLLDYREHPDQASWRDLGQRILSELGAQAAHDRRQVGRPDGGDDSEPIDRGRLRWMGMTDPEIDAATIARALGAAMDAKAAGYGRVVRRAAMLGLRQAGLPRKTQLHFLMLLGQSFLPVS